MIPLDPIPEEECGQTVSEQREALLIMRATEKKWSKRCLYAIIIFLVTLSGVIVGIVFAI